MVDATGKTLGPVLNVNGPFFKVPDVPFKLSNSIFMLAVIKTKFGGSGIPTSIYFNSRRCNHQTGQAAAAMSDIAILLLRSGPLWELMEVLFMFQLLMPNPFESFKSLSRLVVEPNGNVECQEIPLLIPTAIPATPLVNMLTLFTPPFAVEALTK